MNTICEHTPESTGNPIELVNEAISRQNLSVAPSSLRHYDVHFHDCNDERVGGHIFSFDVPSAEFHGHLPYKQNGQDLLVRAKASYFDAVAFRSNLPVIGADLFDGNLLTLERLETQGASLLGSRYLPSAGSSCETCTLTASAVSESPKSEPQERWVSAQDLVDVFLAGGETDMKLLLGVLRLADQLNISLQAQLPIGKHTKGLEIVSNKVKFGSANEVAATLHQSPEIPGVAFTLKCSEVPSPQASFLNEHPTENGSVVVRRGIDAVDVAAYTWRDERLHILFKRGIRPALCARILADGQKPLPTSGLAFEGIAESLEGERSIAEVGKRAQQGIQEEAGIMPIGEARYIGRAFPSPHRHAEMAYSFMIEVDPGHEVSAPFSPDERIDVWAVPVEDVIELCKQAIIRDPRLEINARLLKAALTTGPGTSET